MFHSFKMWNQLAPSLSCSTIILIQWLKTVHSSINVNRIVVYPKGIYTQSVQRNGAIKYHGEEESSFSNGRQPNSSIIILKNKNLSKFNNCIKYESNFCSIQKATVPKFSLHYLNKNKNVLRLAECKISWQIWNCFLRCVDRDLSELDFKCFANWFEEWRVPSRCTPTYKTLVKEK